MKIKHKIQRKLDPSFQAALKLCSLLGLTTWWQRMVCVGSGDGPWCWLSGAHLPGRCTCGVRGGVVFSASGLQQVAQWCSLRLALFGVIWEGTLGPLVLGLSIPPPSLQALHRRAPKRISQNPAFTLPASEMLLVLFFLSQTVVPKIANPRKHGEAHNDANTWGFIYKLELLSKYAWHRGAGTWTPRWVFA